MSKSEISILIVLVIVLGAGIWLGGFLGGGIAGFALAMILLSTLGRYQANKSVARIDKRLRDIIVDVNTIK